MEAQRESSKGLLRIIQLAMAELGLKTSSVSVSYVFFKTHIIFYNIQKPGLLKKFLKVCQVLKLEYFLINIFGKTILIKNTWSLSVLKALTPHHCSKI